MTLQLATKLFQVHTANKSCAPGSCVPAFSLAALFVQSDLGTESAELVQFHFQLCEPAINTLLVLGMKQQCWVLPHLMALAVLEATGT